MSEIDALTQRALAEIAASESSEAIEALRAWLHEGPPQARVEQVERDSGTPDDVPAEGRFLVR